MKNDKAPRRKSDEKRKRKQWEAEEHEDTFFREKMKKRPYPGSRKNISYDDADWH